jgi:UDP-N-acetylglucosamine acyltransferase
MPRLSPNRSDANGSGMSPGCTSIRDPIDNQLLRLPVGPRADPVKEGATVANIHPSAIIESGVELGRDVHVGPFCVIRDGAVIGDRCRLESHVVIHAGVTLGCDNQIHESVVLGGRPQHLHATCDVGPVRIGRGNTIREHVTVHCALEATAETAIGDHNLLMVNSHVAHDCRIGNHSILVNNVMLAGHVTVEDRAYLSGGVGVHQFCRIGKLSMVRGLGRVTQDVPPYVMFDGLSRKVTGLNVVGLRRNGFTPADVLQLKSAYRVIYRSGLPWSAVLETLAQQFSHGPAAAFGEFLAAGDRGFVQSKTPARQRTLSMVPASGDDNEDELRLGKAA